MNLYTKTTGFRFTTTVHCMGLIPAGTDSARIGSMSTTRF